MVTALFIGILGLWQRHPIYGITLHVVRSGAQSSLISSGSAVISRPYPTYAPHDLVATHPLAKGEDPAFGRVVSQSSGQYQIVGIQAGNPNGRVWLADAALQGKVVAVLFGIGYLVAIAATPVGFVVFALGSLGLIIGPSLYQFLRDLHEINRKKAADYHI